MLGAWSRSLMLAISVISSVSWAENASDWLVELRSTYNDLAANGQENTFFGAGIVFSFNRATYVLTSSHVSQGADLKVLYHSKELRVSRAVSRVGHDLEIIKVESHVPSYWAFDSKTGQILSKSIYDTRDGKLFVDQGLNYAAIRGNSSAKGGLALLPELSKEADLIREDAIGSILYPRSEGDDNYVSLPIAIMPGMSGSPLILPLTTGRSRLEVSGVTTHRLRQFRMSYFTSTQAIRRLVEDLKAGKEGSLDNCRWKLSGGVTFRDCGHFKEYMEGQSPSQKTTGGGHNADGGGGHNADGGGGHNADGGGGHNADGSDSLNSEGPRTGPEFYSRRLEIPAGFAGIEWQGQPTIGFWIKRQGRSVPVFADFETAYELDQGMDKDISFEAIGVDVSPMDVLASRLSAEKISHCRLVRGDLQDFGLYESSLHQSGALGHKSNVFEFSFSGTADGFSGYYILRWRAGIRESQNDWERRLVSAQREGQKKHYEVSVAYMDYLRRDHEFDLKTHFPELNLGNVNFKIADAHVWSTLYRSVLTSKNVDLFFDLRSFFFESLQNALSGQSKAPMIYYREPYTGRMGAFSCQ